jgi:uroporphyrinogen III methyltransferase/synthase
VKAAFERLNLAGKDARSFGAARVAAIGPATADALREYGILADAMPDEYRAEGVLDTLFEAGVKAGDRILIPRAREAREILPETLRERGVAVDLVCAYETHRPDGSRTKELLDKLRDGAIDAISFASSSTVKNFMALLAEACPREEALALLEGVKLASIGPITSQTILEEGLSVAIEAENYTIKGLTTALEALFKTGVR